MSIVNTLSLESNRQIKINFDGGGQCFCSADDTDSRMILPGSSTATLKAAWLAAAQAAKLAGYPCAAKAVEHSVLGINYKEDNGSFAEKIKTTSTFKDFLSATKNSNKSHDSAVREFTKSDNSDLFYALHNATVTLNKSGTNYKVHVYDVFDFALDNNYDSLFTSAVNNWAWLSQQTGVLHKITINIDFTS